MATNTWINKELNEKLTKAAQEQNEKAKEAELVKGEPVKK